MLGTLVGGLVALALVSPAEAQNAMMRSFSQTPGKSIQILRSPAKRRPQSVGVKTSAPSVFVADVASGRVLFAKNAHRVMPIASLTKLVTAMVVLDQHPDLSRLLTVTEEDEDAEHKMVFVSGEAFTEKEFLEAMLAGSVNTAANTLARTFPSREKFVEAMNAKTRALGLKSPHFLDPSGIDPQNRANAADVAAILSTALRYPEILEATKKEEVVLTSKTTKKEYHLKTTNLLLRSFLNQKPYGIVAAKTGSLPGAGYCMAQVTRHATGPQVVAVELGSENTFSRFQDIKALTAWAFDTYAWE